MGDLITLEEFAEHIGHQPVPRDLSVTDERFALVGTGPSLEVQFAGMPAGPLPMYQAKSMAGASNIDLRGTTNHLRTARSAKADDERYRVARATLARQVNELNSAIDAAGRDERSPMIARISAGDDGREYVGGLVSKDYAPLTHVQLVETMLETPGLVDARVHRMRVTAARMEATLMFNNSEWKVDGGVKAGIRIGNGQFGDKAFSLVAMLFRLLCTNGMMDVLDSATVFKRHVGMAIQLETSLKTVLERADGMFLDSTQAMNEEVDVIEGLVELYRHGLLNRGAFKKTLVRRDETVGGRQVEGATTTLWGLSQAVTAAARDYGFTQMNSMGVLAGRLVHEGIDGVISGRREVNDDHEEILEELGIAA